MILKSRKEWLSVRARGIGASEAAAILGVSPWKSGLQLFYEKKGVEPPPAGETFARSLGLLLEQPIADLYAEQTKRKVFRARPGEFDVQVHPTNPIMLATMDGRVIGRPDDDNEAARDQEGALEIKTAAISKAQLWTNEVPIDYQVQVQHQLAVTGLPFGAVAALIGGVSLRYDDIKRDQEFIELLEAACSEFWRRFELNDPPPADGTEATKEFLKRHYAKAAPSSATLGPDALEWDAELQRAKADIKEATGRKLLAENRFKQAIGENVQGLLPNGVVYTWKVIPRKGYTVAPTEYRDFRRKGGKDEKPKKAMPTLSEADLAATFADQQASEESFDGE